MPWPRTGTFGLIDNPVIVSPFVDDENSGGSIPPPVTNEFLLLNGGNFLLLNGSDLLLL